MNTAWEDIYREYIKTGKKWATLNDSLHPAFISLIEKSSFLIRNVLDIGCGDGRYLKYLQDNNFKITGIDSSHSAIMLAKNLLKDSSILLEMDMFEYIPEKNHFDLIISHAALHHGIKSNVIKLVNRFCRSLIVSGKFFISLPSDDSLKNWVMMSNHKKLEDGTCIPLAGPEMGLPHSFYSENEINSIFSMFGEFYKYKQEIDGRWIIIGEKEY